MIVTDKKDLPPILELQKKAFHEVAVRHNDLKIQPVTQTLEQIEEEFDSGTAFFKFLFEGEIAGSVRAKMIDEATCFIGKLIVHPDLQNRGIGTKLMHEVEEYFKDKCSKFTLFTGEKNEHVLRLYSKSGYRITGSQNSGAYSLIHMEKDSSHA
ncbi:MAG: GNAT family N-acetyltransferase [Tannerella sp.]|jgi:ribosomal protein S18 acetylase RimI-like enzyme|nr:GNAT family N-acetyltransferase [Tannerella sp.]